MGMLRSRYSKSFAGATPSSRELILQTMEISTQSAVRLPPESQSCCPGVGFRQQKMRFRVGFTLPGPPAPGSAWDFWHTHAAIDHVACAVPRHAQVAEHTLRRPRAPPNMRDSGYLNFYGSSFISRRHFRIKHSHSR